MNSRWKTEKCGELRYVDVRIILSEAELEIFELLNAQRSVLPETRATWLIQDWARKFAEKKALEFLRAASAPKPMPVEDSPAIGPCDLVPALGREAGVM